MIFVNILLGVVASVLLLGVIGERDVQSKQCITFAFATVVLLIITANTIM